jgi:hypothetical protein
MICKSYLERSSGELNNQGMLSILNLSEEVSFSARIRLVVAMRLQEQHSSFQLRTSSHMPSVLMNVAHGSFHKFREGNALSICKFCLKKRLDKSTQFKTRLQFEQAYQPVRTNP